MKISLTAEKKPLLSKALLIMKLSIVLLICFTLQASAKGFGQKKLDLQFQKTEIATILSTIEKSTNYRFLYDNNLKGLKLKINLSVKDADVKQVLDQMFQNTGLSYQFMDNNLIVIKSADDPGSEVQTVITGKVLGDNNVPLAGVSVQVKGTTKGTTTNTEGVYSINASDSDVLVFSYVGYESQELPVAGKTEIDVTLVLSTQSLAQVVVIGYGTQKKRDLTGSIAVISGDDVAKLPASNPVASLQGKVAGLTIVNSGQAGSSPTVRIRGVNSTNNADPLYVVDGILQTNIDYLNPADVETIEVLKDPSSIAIYGLQGGNGVIIITTKRAKRGETNISFTTNIGVQQVNNKIKVADAAGFKKLYSEQLANIGAAPFDFSNYNANTNWQDEIYRSAILDNNSLSISNSTDKSTTYLNLGYSDQQGVEKYDHYQKYIGRLNEEIRITKNIKVGADLTGFYWKQNPPVGGIENEALWAAPIVPVQAGPGLYYAMPSFQRAQVINPLAAIDQANGNTINNGYRVTGNVYAEIKFLKNFTWKSTFYTDLGFNQSRGYQPLPFHYLNVHEDGTPGADTSYAVNPHTSVNQSQTVYKTYQQDHTLTFDKTLNGGHHLTVLAGFSTLYHYNEFINGNRTDTSLYIPDNSMFWYLNIAQQSNPGNFAGGAAEDASMSFLGRVNYSYKNRYLLNVSYRRDGTSKFSPSHQWGDFGSVGAGWVMTDENFMRDIQWLDFLKIKASWGTVGNGLNIGNYLSYPGLNNSNVGIFGNNIYPSVTAAYVPDPNLHWEVVEGKDAGFESRMLRNRLSLDVDFYDRKTHDILTSITLPGASGNTTYFTNLGSIDNKGIEVTAGWGDKIGRDFSYSINGNFSINKNNVESIGNDINFQITNGVNLTESGYPIGFFYGYEQAGIYQTTAQIDKTPHMASAAPGDIIFKDVNGDGKIDQNDRTYLGSPFPKYNFGADISLRYKGFDLLVEAQGVAGNKIYVQRRTYTFATLNYEVNRLNAWTGPGTTNIEPILDNTRSNNFLFSNYWLEPGDYFRLRTLQLGYTFNTATTLKNSGIKTLRIYLNAQNVATFTHATGYTPEVPIGNPTTAGADNGVYPVPAIYSFGVNLTF
ncbi:MAG TPA: TonB-dependent receptor [Chitinophagaceae bacterium]|nr:TonB-dependent receptor [Chitinophagaceae bacterium]